MLAINETITEGKTTLALTGKLDTATAPELGERLMPLCEDGKCDVVLELSSVQYISSAGLRVLLLAEKQMQKHGRMLIVEGASPAIREVFDLTGFSDMLNIV